jgi:hypothetical protein
MLLSVLYSGFGYHPLVRVWAVLSAANQAHRASFCAQGAPDCRRLCPSSAQKKSSWWSQPSLGISPSRLLPGFSQDGSPQPLISLSTERCRVFFAAHCRCHYHCCCRRPRRRCSRRLLHRLLRACVGVWSVFAALGAASLRLASAPPPPPPVLLSIFPTQPQPGSSTTSTGTSPPSALSQAQCSAPAVCLVAAAAPWLHC